MIKARTIAPDGEHVAFAEGETVLAMSERTGKRIPTLCHDPRLEPAGCCRTRWQTRPPSWPKS